jgi:hypothetical protein
MRLPERAGSGLDATLDLDQYEGVGCGAGLARSSGRKAIATSLRTGPIGTRTPPPALSTSSNDVAVAERVSNATTA